MRQIQAIISAMRKFRKTEDGNIAIIGALAMVPMLLSAGMAIDYSYASSERVNLQILADSAALAAGAEYDGTNPKVAMQIADGMLARFKASVPPDYAFEVTIKGLTVQVSARANAKNSFMTLGGHVTTPIGVSSTAVIPIKPKKLNFTPTKAQGWYYKKVSIILVRPNSSKEEVVGTVIYQPKTQVDGGQGTMTVNPTGTLQLGEYTKLILQMEIKHDGCGIGEIATINRSIVNCSRSSRAASQKYDSVRRTDNPLTSHFLFVEGKQLPQGVESPLQTILECGVTASHAWEDSDKFERQDFFYEVKSECAPDGRFVRLSK